MTPPIRCSTTLAALVLLCAVPASALDPHKALTQYSRRSWGMDEGLPQNTGLALAQTRDGYLWVGTEEGLARFDGVRFQVFEPSNTPELPDTIVVGLVADRSGGLWISMRRGLAYYKDGRFRRYGAAEGLPEPLRCPVVFEDRRGRVWIGTTAGLGLLEAGRVVPQDERLGLPGGRVSAIHETRDGSLWVASRKPSLSRVGGGALLTYSVEDGLPHEWVNTLLEDAQGRLWIGSEGGGVALWQDGRITSPLEKDARRVFEMTADRDGNLWIAAGDAGLMRYREGRLERLGSRRGLPEDFAASLLEDHEGNLWIGTRAGGVTRLSDSRFTAYTTREGLSGEIVGSVITHENDTWVATESGLNRLRGGKVETFTTRDGLLSDDVRALWRDRRGQIWVGTDRGINVIRGARVSPFTLTRAAGLADDVVTAVIEDRRGDVWITTDGALHRWRSGHLTTYTTADGLSGHCLSGLYEGRDGALWIMSSDDGVTRLKEGRFTSFTPAEGLRSSRVLTVYEDAEGAVWLGTVGGGLSRLLDGRIKTILPEHGLPTDKVAHVLEDDRGHLWMSSNKGIFRVSKRDLHAVADGRLARISPTTYGKADGMPSPEGRLGAPAGWRSADGRLWFPTVKGLVVVDPAQLEPRTTPPPVVLEEMRVNGQVVALGGGLELAPGSNAIELRYTGLGLTAPEELRFRYRLDGFDAEWHEAGTRRAAYYTNLPPGRYVFRVTAGTHEGVWNEAGATLAFALRPRFHQTAWFFALVVTATIGGALALHRFKVTLLEARNAVLEERNRIAREVHDGVAQGLGGIAMQLEAARGARDTMGKAEHVDRARTLADQTLTELRRSLSALRPALLDGLSLPEALERFIEPFAAGAGVEARLEVRGAESDLREDLAADVLRIAQEALYNAARHARAQRVDVRLTYEPDRLHLRIADDGVGLEGAPPMRAGVGGLGLRTMRDRAERCGGRLSMRSDSGGTEVTVTVPIRRHGALLLWSALERLRVAGLLRRRAAST